MAEPTTTNSKEEEEVIEQLPDDLEQEELEEAVVPEVVEEVEEKPISRREQLRVQDLLAKYGDKETEEKPVPKPQVPSTLNYNDTIEADPELVKQLEEDRRKYGETLYNQGLEQSKALQFQTRLEIDAPRIESKYPVLDKNSEEFHPAVANAINQLYLSSVGFDKKTGTVQNADLRYADYAEGIFELAEEIALVRTEASRKNVVEQAANTGLRPDGSGTKKLNLNQAPGSMSDEELDAFLAKALPKK